MVLHMFLVIFVTCLTLMLSLVLISRCHLCKPPLNNDFEEGSEMDTGSSGVMVSIADELVRNTGN